MDCPVPLACKSAVPGASAALGTTHPPRCLQPGSQAPSPTSTVQGRPRPGHASCGRSGRRRLVGEVPEEAPGRGRGWRRGGAGSEAPGAGPGCSQSWKARLWRKVLAWQPWNSKATAGLGWAQGLRKSVWACACLPQLRLPSWEGHFHLETWREKNLGRGGRGGSQAEELGGEQVCGRMTGTLLRCPRPSMGHGSGEQHPAPAPKAAGCVDPPSPKESEPTGFSGCLPAGSPCCRPGSRWEWAWPLCRGRAEGRPWGACSRRGEERPDSSLGGCTRHPFPDPGPPQQAEVRFKTLQAKMPTSEGQRCPGLARCPVRASFPSRAGAEGARVHPSCETPCPPDFVLSA